MAESNNEKNKISKNDQNIGEVLKNLNDEIISLFGLYSAVSPYDSLANSLKQSFNHVLDYVDNLREFAQKQDFSSMPDMIKNMWNFYQLNIKNILSVHGDRLKIISFDKNTAYKKLFNNIVDKYSKINQLSKKIINFNL